MVPWEPQDLLESLAEGVVPDLTVLGACQDSLDLRETEGLMVWLDFLVKKDTEVNLAPPDLLVLLERMERGEMMERSDPGDFLVNQDPAVCWDQKDLRDLLDPLVLLEWMATLDPKETSDLKESQDLPDSKATQVPRDFLVLKEPLDHQERRAQLENPACQECQELMVLRVTLEKRGLLERKDTWALLALKDPLVILGPEA